MKKKKAGEVEMCCPARCGVCGVQVLSLSTDGEKETLDFR